MHCEWPHILSDINWTKAPLHLFYVIPCVLCSDFFPQTASLPIFSPPSLSVSLFASLSVSFCLWWFPPPSSFVTLFASVTFWSCLWWEAFHPLPAPTSTLTMFSQFNLFLLHNNVSFSLTCCHNKSPRWPLNMCSRWHWAVSELFAVSSFWSVCLTNWE